MKKMICNTVFVWLIALGVLLAISLVTLIATRDGIAVFIIALFSAIFIAFISVIITGVKAAQGTGYFTMGLLFAFVFGYLLIILKIFDFSKASTLFIILLPPFIYLVSYGLEYAKLSAVNNGQTKLSWAISVVFIFSCCIGVFIFGALQSKTAFPFLPEELFFTKSFNDISNVVLPNFSNEAKERRLHLINDDAPYTGVITTYKSKLRIDISTPKAKGITYYIDGLKFGSSGEVLPAGLCNIQNGAYCTSDFWNFLEQQRVDSNSKVLLYKDYESFIKQELPTENIIYYKETSLEQDNVYNPDFVLKATIVYAYPTSLVRKEVTLQHNGVVQRIDSVTFRDGEWINGAYKTANNKEILNDMPIFFDELGYRTSLILETDEHLK